MSSKNILSKAILAVTGVVLSATSAMAQNPNYAPGDVVLYFQQFGGSNTVALNLGAGTTFRDATANILNIANIGSLLADNTTGFGSSWYDQSNLYMGAAGVRSNSPITTTQVNGDGSRTIYVSQNRNVLGTEGSAGSIGLSGFSNTDMTTGSNGIIALTNRLETTSLTSTLVEGTSASVIDDQNPFLGQNPGTAFGIFPGGVQTKFGTGSFGTFGGVAAEAAVDLYRILAAAPSGTVESGPLRTGQFQGTFVIDQAGAVSFIVAPVAVPEPTTMVATLVIGCAAAAMRRRRQVAA